MSEYNDKVYVSLDLGSESMAAYYENARGAGGMIQLQSRAPYLLGMSEEDADREEAGIDFLYDEANNRNRRSARLWNRISFMDKRQPHILPEQHAELKFSDQAEYEKSLFSIFHPKAAWPPMKVMPNPKILFQHQIKDILPKVEAMGGGHIDLSPELLIRHLSLQIITNLVLGSEELKDVDPRNIDLTITVPNVYSLPHSKSIKDFVTDHIPELGDVDIISESEAIAYYVLSGDDANDSEELKIFKAEMQKALNKRRQLCIVTFDVGKGTTDLSCILKQEPVNTAASPGILSKWLGASDAGGSVVDEPGRQRHSVQGKTGRSSGGNYLNYLFAVYYDECLRKAAPEIRQATGRTVRFFFLQKDDTFSIQQGYAVFKLYNLIEQIKRNITENYEIDIEVLTEERQVALINPVVDFLLDADVPDWRDNKDLYKDFRQQVIQALLLPQKFERKWTQRFFSPTPTPTETLKHKIENYVTENVDKLLDSLKKQVREHQAVIKDRNEREEIDRNTFVVVSGQGSQFRPLRKAITEKCDQMNISEEHRYMMKGVASKEACCRGVINFRAENIWHINPRELHGTYGCLARGKRPDADIFQPFNMSEIKNGGQTSLSFSSASAYYVVFTPRSYEETLLAKPVKNDGYTAIIEVFNQEANFTIEYNEKTLQLKVNDRLLELKTFGNMHDSIYPKVWPEILDPGKNLRGL